MHITDLGLGYYGIASLLASKELNIVKNKLYYLYSLRRSELIVLYFCTEMPDFLKKLRLAALGVAKRRGEAPSPLASRDSSVSAADSVAVNCGECEGHTSSDHLLQSLRTTLFLF